MKQIFIFVSTHSIKKNIKTLQNIIAYNALHNIDWFQFTKKDMDFSHLKVLDT